MRNIHTPWAWIILPALVSFSFAQDVDAQQPNSVDASESVQLQRWRNHYAQLASQQQFIVGEVEPKQLSLRLKPLHFFSNPAGGTQSHGSIFIWTKDSKPWVLGALWSRKVGETRRVSGSYHSGALDKLVGISDGEVFWQPKQNFALTTWPTETVRAASAPLRLVQMKNMMRSMEVTRIHEDQRSKLRVLSQPLYRYQNDELIDGAIFGFFENWDPELFVIVEARAEQSSRWAIGLIRFSNKRLEARVNKVPIWEYDPEGNEPPLGGADYLYVSNTIETRSYLIEAVKGD